MILYLFFSSNFENKTRCDSVCWGGGQLSKFGADQRIRRLRQNNVHRNAKLEISYQVTDGGINN